MVHFTCCGQFDVCCISLLWVCFSYCYGGCFSRVEQKSVRRRNAKSAAFPSKQEKYTGSQQGNYSALTRDQIFCFMQFYL